MAWDIRHGQGFVEVGDRCWVARHAWFDVNVGLVAGERGVLVIDTHASESAAAAVVDDVRRLGAGEVVAVVNTHEHFDHVLGNAVFRREYGAVPILAHEEAADRMSAAVDRIKHLYRAEPDDPHAADVLASEAVPPDGTFSSARVVDLGDRFVEVVHPGRGHTGGDAVVRVPDADVTFAGDLVEESAARNGVPGFGDDCFPLEWPGTLDTVAGLLTERSVVVPGHGLPVDRDFLMDQRAGIGVVAETIRDLAGKGVPAAEALAAADWPYPAEELVHAIARGYQHLPRSARSLPLL